MSATTDKLSRDQIAKRVAQELEDGFYVNVSAWPSVPMKRSGLRFSVTALHELDDIRALVAIDGLGQSNLRCGEPLVLCVEVAVTGQPDPAVGSPQPMPSARTDDRGRTAASARPDSARASATARAQTAETPDRPSSSHS